MARIYGMLSFANNLGSLKTRTMAPSSDARKHVLPGRSGRTPLTSLGPPDERHHRLCSTDFPNMNWTEGVLYRTSRGRLRKPESGRQRMKEYFARSRIRTARIRAAEAKEAREPSHALPVSHACPPSSRRQPSHVPDHNKTRSRPTPKPDDGNPPLLIFSRFFSESPSRVGDRRYSEEEMKRMRQELLAKDWGVEKMIQSHEAQKRSRLAMDKKAAQDSTIDDKRPAHTTGATQATLSRRRLYRRLLRGGVRVRVSSQEKLLGRTSAASESSRFASSPTRSQPNVAEVSPSMNDRNGMVLPDTATEPLINLQLDR